MQLHEIRNKISADTPEDILAFIDSHLLMLEDPAFDVGVIAIIREHQCNAEWALHMQSERHAGPFVPIACATASGSPSWRA